MTKNLNIDFHFFDPFDDLEIYHGDLPHWRQEGVVYFVTFRLADSLPKIKLQQLRQDRAIWVQMNKHKKRIDFTKEDWKTYNYLFHERIENWLEEGYGSCVLQQKDVLAIIVNTLKHFDGERYILDSFVIMPNHIHIIVIPLRNFTLSQITHSWKSFSANQINKLLGKTGQFWNHESYDHIIRNEESLAQIRKYIKLNPVKASILLSDTALKVPEASNVPEVSLLRNEMHTEAGSFGNIRKNLTIILVFLSSFLQAQNEAHYIDIIAAQMNGTQEQMVQNGRVDIVTATHAIEVEWATNWKHSIGQALWYGLQTNKAPGIVLIMKTIEDRKYGIMLISALDYAGISDKIKVWFYPEDFGGSYEGIQAERQEHLQNLIETFGQYTLNENSGVRHNSKCTYFDCGNCVSCGPTDGNKACGKCGG